MVAALAARQQGSKQRQRLSSLVHAARLSAPHLPSDRTLCVRLALGEAIARRPRYFLVDNLRVPFLSRFKPSGSLN